ncbi:Apple protein [Mycena venus]|uniref:Apple protein n=1 Tax=Mycena venus TaxID=2733690 RepID=A0A8H6Y894_9AGAR|nr:Apple protein [Mycena venus]
MILFPLVAHILFLLVPLISAHTPKYRRIGPRHSRHHILHPTVHPVIDRTHPKHLTPNQGLYLYYHDPHAAFPHIRSFASVYVSGFTHPALILEHSAHVISTRCDVTSSAITVGFRDRAVWSRTVDAWKQHPKFLIVAFADSCGMGRESGERSVHLVHNFTSVWSRMEIVCQMSELSLTDAIHPDRPVTIQVDTFDVHDTDAHPIFPAYTRRTDGPSDESSDHTAGNSTGTSQNPSEPESSSDTNSTWLPPNSNASPTSDESSDHESGNSTGTAQNPAQPEGSDSSGTNSTSLVPDGSPSSEQTMSNATSDDLDYDYVAACYYGIEILSDDQLDECFNSWGRQQEMNEEEEGFYRKDALDDDSLLGISDVSDNPSDSLARRAKCEFTWNPIALLRNCVILPVTVSSIKEKTVTNLYFQVLKAILPSAIYNIIDAITGVFGKYAFCRDRTHPDSVQLDVEKLYKFFEAVVQVVVAVLSEDGYTPSGEVTFDTNNSLIPLQNTADFGWAYPLASLHPTEVATGSTTSVLGTISVVCLGCRINGVSLLLAKSFFSHSRQFMKHRSKFKFTLTAGFTSAYVELVDGSIDFAAGIGILFDITAKGKIAEETLFELPLSPLTIPGIIVIGPFLSIKAGVGYELGAKGKVIARNNIGWSNMTAKLDMIDGKNSYTGTWTRHDPVPLVSVELAGYAKLDPYITAGLYFGVSILSGKLKVSAGIEAKASLPVTAQIAVKGGTDMATTFEGCGGVTVSLAAKLEIYLTIDAGKYNRHYYPQELEFGIFSKCIDIPIAVVTDKLVPDVAVPVLPPIDPNATYRTMNAQVGKGNATLNVVWLPKPNGNLIVIPPAEVIDGAGSIHRLFLSLTTSERNATAGIYDNRVLHYDQTLMHFLGVSPLVLSPEEAIPKKAVVVVFRTDIDRDGLTRFVGMVSGSKTGELKPEDYFYPIVCIYEEKYRTPARLFLAQDQRKGTDILMIAAQRKTSSKYHKKLLDGPPFAYCDFVKFAIS